MELEERIKTALEYGKTLPNWIKKKDCEEFKLYNSLSYELRKERLTSGCGSCVSEFYNYLLHISNEKINQMNNGKFKIGKSKSGANKQIHCINSNVILTDDNLTDEKAIALLKGNKKFIACFDEFPDNWEKLLGEGGKTKKEAPTKDDVEGKYQQETEEGKATREAVELREKQEAIAKAEAQAKADEEAKIEAEKALAEKEKQVTPPPAHNQGKSKNHKKK